MTPYDWASERDRRRFLRPVLFAVTAIAALTLIGIGVWMLVVPGRPAGWIVIAVAAVFAATAIGIDWYEHEARQ